MAKYSFELKMEVVCAYLDGNVGFNDLSKNYSIPYSIIRDITVSRNSKKLLKDI